MSTTEELFELLGKAETDKVHIEALKARLKASGLWELMGCPPTIEKRNTPPPAAPMASEITAVRAALFDNWFDGCYVKGQPNRFGMSIDIWTLPADDIEAIKLRSMNQQFKCNISLMPRKALRAQIKSLRKPRINELSNVDPKYLALLEDLSAENPNTLIGLIHTKVDRDDSEYHRGIYYHPNQFVLVNMDGKTVQSAGIITGNEEPILLPTFATTDFNGDKLPAKIIGQSRLDRVGFDPEWATNK